MLMSKAEFLRMLVDIAQRVVSGDSFEGRLQYDRVYTGGFHDPSRDKIEVMASYRTGNLTGQGSYVLIEGSEDDIPF